MSTSIDSRVVAMKFDGAQFKREAASALSMLDKLKAKMNEHALGRGIVKGASMGANFLNMINPINLARKAMGALSGDVAKFNTGNMEGQIGGVSKAFLAMSTVAITAISNITNRVVNAGLTWAKSFTVGPILDGLHEYETNLKSIQTIQANTDKPLPVITAALKQLNDYSDQTIYNFSEMARNIGTFTAAGVGLKDAVSSIKGIANMAALSGSSSEQAATAMYQLSQAIASGKVGLMDWNSVVNAGMGGKKLQNALAQTGIAMGELDKSQVKLVGSMKKLQINGTSFREAIMSKPGDKPWLTSEVLVNTLASLDGRFSRAALSQELLADGTKKYNTTAEVTAKIEANRAALAKKGVKYTDEQFAAMMKLSDAAFKSATEVKTLGQVFDIARETLGSGWAATFENIFGNLGEAKKLFTGMSDSINAFIRQDSLARNTMLAGWKKLGGRDTLIQGLKNGFQALFNILKPIGQAFRDIFPRKTAAELVSMTEGFARFTESLIIGKGSMEGIRSTFKGLFAIISIGLNVVSNIIRYFFTLGQLLLGLGGGDGGILSVTGSIGDLLAKIQEWLVQGGRIDDFFTKVIEGRAKMFGPIIEAIASVVDWLVKLVEITVGDIFGWATGHADDFEKIADGLSKIVNSGIEKLTTWFKPIAADVRDLASSFQELVSAGADKLVESLAGGLDELGPLVQGALQSIKDSISGLGDSGGLLSGFKDAFNLDEPAAKIENGVVRVKDAMDGSAVAADAAKRAWDRVVAVFRRLGEVLGPVGDSINQAFGNLKELVSKGIDSLTFEDIVKAINVGIFAGLLLIFRKFGKSFGSVMDGVKGVLNSGSGVLDQVKGNLKSMQNEVRADMILKIAAAVGILALSLLVLSTIPGKKLAVSLGAVAVMLIMLTKTMAVLNKQADDMNAIDAGKMVLLSVAISALGVGMAAMAGAIAILGHMDTKTIVKGLVTIGAVLAIVTAAAAVMAASGGGAAILAASVAIAILSVALTAFAGTMMLYSKMDPDKMMDAGKKIGLMLVGLGIAMMFMQGSLGGAAALFVISAALTAMIPPMLFFMNMDDGKMKTMLKNLVLFFAALALSGVLAPLIGLLAVSLLLLGTAILAIGAGLTLVGVGMGLFAAALVVFAASGTAAFAVITAAITVFLAMFPMWMAQLGVALAALSKVIREQGPPLVEAMGTVLRAILNEITKSIPALGRLFQQLIQTGLTVFRNNFPHVIAAGIAFITTLLTAIRNNVTKITPIAIDIVVRFINTLANNMGRITASGANLIIKFLQGLTRQIPKMQKAATDTVVKFLQGIGNNSERIIDAGIKMIIQIMNGVATGIRNNSDAFNAAGRNIASAIVSGAANGIRDLGGAVKDAAIGMASRAFEGAMGFLRAKSPSRLFMDVGSYVPLGFAIGIGSKNAQVEGAAENMGRKALDTIQVAMKKINDVAPDAVDLSPTITPILDLTKLQNEATKIGSALDPGVISPDVSFGKALSILEDRVGEREDAATPEPVVKEVKLEQNNYSPKALSTLEIYRNTQSQLAMAKEALT